MAKRKTTDESLNPTKPINTNTDFVFYEPARDREFGKVSPTKICK